MREGSWGGGRRGPRRQGPLLGKPSLLCIQTMPSPQHWGLRGREDHVSEAVWKSLVSAHLSSATIHVSGSTVWLEDRMLVLEMMPWLLPLGEFDRSFTGKAEKMFFHLGRHLPYSSVLEADKSIVLKVQV